MEFNRLVSLVVGFIVLILLFVWISNRFRANTRTTGKQTVTISPTVKATVTPTKGPSTGWNPFGFLAKKTPTPTKIAVKISPTPIKVKVENGNAPQGQSGQTVQITQAPQQTEVVYKNYKTGKTIVVNEIPETGAPTILLSLALAGLTSGIYLKKRI